MFANNLYIYVALYASCVLTFVLYGYDKHCATYAKRRIPEFLLLALTALLGGFGAICGMVIFRHKTEKKIFSIGVPVLLLLQVLGLAFYFTHY